jgi:hypothetical protein
MIRFCRDDKMAKGLTSTRGVPPPLEERLAAAVAAMRAEVADYGEDDFHENRSRTLLDQRPLVVVAVAVDGQTKV